MQSNTLSEITKRFSDCRIYRDSDNFTSVIRNSLSISEWHALQTSMEYSPKLPPSYLNWYVLDSLQAQILSIFVCLLY